MGPVVLLPGLLCDAVAWEDQVRGLSDVVDCLVPDLTGHPSIEAMAGAVLRQQPGG